MRENAIQNIFLSCDVPTVLPQQKKAVRDIRNCHTSVLGGVKTTCQDCKETFFHYRSCGNRNCTCQALKQYCWAETKSCELLKTTYFHAVFTVPDDLNPVMLRNQKACYDLLFRSVSETLETLASDPKHLNARIGFICVLHTWGSNLQYHPHIHVIIMGCGLNQAEQLVMPKGDFLFPVKVMSKLFRGKFLDGLKKLSLEETINYSNLYGKDWVVYVKDAFPGSDHVIKYLSRYTHRIAISNQRIISYDSTSVTFRYKDYRDGNAIKEMTLSTEEFMRRYLLHVLPKGFCKIRSYGLLSNRHKKKCLKILRILLNMPERKDRYKDKSVYEILAMIDEKRYCTCPRCGSRNLFREWVYPLTG